MEEIATQLEAADAALSALARVDRSSLSDAELCELTRVTARLSRLVSAAGVQNAAEVAERSRFELGGEGLSARNGFPKPLPFLEYLTGDAQFDLAGQARLGAAIRPRTTMTGEPVPAEFPAVGDGLRSGRVSTTAGAAIVLHLRKGSEGAASTPDRVAAAEKCLTDLAADQPTATVVAAARAWRDALDPDGAEPRFEDIRSRRGLSKGQERNGVTEWHLRTDPTGTALLNAVLDQATAPGTTPRFLDHTDRYRGTTRTTDTTGTEVETLTDPRSATQKRLDTLIGVLTAGLRASHDTTPDLRATGTVIATITLKELETGTGIGWLAGVTEPIPATRVQQMMCDARLRIHILGPGNTPLFEAVPNRYFTDAHRRALLTRDGDTCCGPGCRTPAAWADAHHIDYHSRGGPTTTANGILLCGPCHTALHNGHYQIRMRNGRPQLRLGIDTHDPTAWHPTGHPHSTTGTTTATTMSGGAASTTAW